MSLPVARVNALWGRWRGRGSGGGITVDRAEARVVDQEIRGEWYPAPMADVLIIGYGNTLRSDDGVGPMVARRLAEDVRASVIEAVQLLPEHIEMASNADRVVLVDAAVDLNAGVVRCERVRPGLPDGSLLDLHDLSPAGLTRAVDELYGRRPEVWLVSIGAASFDLGEALTPLVGAALREAVAVVQSLLEGP